MSDTDIATPTVEAHPTPEERFSKNRDRLTDWATRQLDAFPEKMEKEEAREWIRSLDFRANLHEDGHHISRFLMGELTRRVLATVPYGEKQDTWEELTEAFGLGSVRTLRYCVGFAETFNGNIRLFDRWLRQGRTKHWNDLIRVSRINIDPEMIGEDDFDTYLISRIEEAVEVVQQANDALDAQDAPEDDPRRQKLESVALLLTEEAIRYRQEGRKLLMDPEEDQFDAALKMFEDMLRSMACAGCGDPPPQDPHHVAPSSAALKQSPWLRAPLCRKCHTLLHTSHEKFKEETGRDIREIVAIILHIWITGEAARFPSGLG